MINHTPLVAKCVSGTLSLLLIAAHNAFAQSGDYPMKSVRVIIPFSAGGATDIAARVISQELSKRFGVQFVADNRPGAGSTLGTRLAARSAPDGYTLLAASSTNFGISPHTYQKLDYSVIRDFAPIGTIATTANGLVTHPSLPAKSVKELLYLAKVRPGDIFYSSSGVGTTAHLAMEMFKTAAGINLIHVPHKGGDSAMMSLVSGDTQVASIVMARVVPLAQAGRLRAIAVTGPRRSALMPNVPTVMESGLRDYEFQLWGGLVAPARTPDSIIQKLAVAMTDILLKSDVKALFIRDGGEALSMTPEQFAILIKADFDRWGRAIKAASIQPE